jgi:mannose-6-phosphate isomerase
MMFKPIFHEKIWGGNLLNAEYNKTEAPEKCGEAWEISGVEGNMSVLKNGKLAGNNLQELIEVYMGDLVGEKVYEKFGNEFPLLIKLIDASDDLSIQVHPDDSSARELHHAWGKTEMWYILDAKKDAKLISGFAKNLDKQSFKSAVEEGEIEAYLNYESVQFGDVFYIPSGRIHSIGKGIVLAEIQQTSDVTYRVFDYNRLGLDGLPRELHTELAAEVLDYKVHNNYRTTYEKLPDRSNEIVECPYFYTGIIPLVNILERNYLAVDSFVILICIMGAVTIKTIAGNLILTKGETALIPAEIDIVRLEPNGYTELLEVYIP